MKREKVIQYLTNCHLVELATIIRQALLNRTDSKLSESYKEAEKEIEYNQSQIVLAEIYRDKNDDDSWSNYNIGVIAEPNMEIYKDEDWLYRNGEPFLQEGHCQRCSIELFSHAKNVICPICSNKESLT